MQYLIQLLRNIGLSEKEAITYLTTLKIGPNPASVIAKHTDLNRSTTYIILESLKKKELISEFEKNRITYFSTLNPTKLINYINSKREDLAFYKEEIIAMLPKFELLKSKCIDKSYVKSYNGLTSVKELFTKIFTENDICIYCIKSKEKHGMFLDFLENHTLNPVNHIRIIINGSKNIQKIKLKNENGIVVIPNCLPTEIIGNQRMVLTDLSNSQGVEITNKEILESFRNKFISIWNQIK